MKLTVPSAAPKQLSRFANPNHLKTGDWNAICAFVESVGRTAQNSRPWWRWRRCIYRPTPVHKVLASRIEETALENLCSNLPLLEVDSCLLLLQRVISQASTAKRVISAFSPPRGSRRPFLRFPVSMSSTPCVIFDSQHNRACCYALLQGGSSIWMQSPVWQPVEPLLYCPLASAEPIYIGAGESVSEGYRPDLLQDVPDQPPHAYKWRPCPCIGQWIRLQDLINPASLSLSCEDPNDEHPEDALPALPH